MTALTGIRRLVIHHSASPRTVTRDDIDAMHKARGWDGVGYHWVIEGSGAIKIGRPLPMMGAHVEGANSDSVGVCLVGNNTAEGEHWSRDQVMALHQIVRAWRVLVPSIAIMGHRDVPGASTLCPGVDARALLALTHGNGG